MLLGLQYAQARHLLLKEVVSDSKVTLGRVFDKWSLKNIPDWLTELKSSLPCERNTGSVCQRSQRGQME